MHLLSRFLCTAHDHFAAVSMASGLLELLCPRMRYQTVHDDGTLLYGRLPKRLFPKEGKLFKRPALRLEPKYRDPYDIELKEISHNLGQ